MAAPGFSLHLTANPSPCTERDMAAPPQENILSKYVEQAGEEPDEKSLTKVAIGSRPCSLDSVEDAISPLTTISREEILLKCPRASGTKVGEPTASGDLLDTTSDVGATLMICRTCRSVKCPVKYLAPWTTSVDRSHADGPAVPPICPICMKAVNRSGTNVARLTRGDNMMRRQTGIFVHVTNLPENTSKRDINNLVCPFGVVAHIDDLQLDENTGSCSKRVTVKFVQRKDAERAISWLNGYSYGSRTLTAGLTMPGVKEVNVAPPICAVCMIAAETSVRVNNLPGETSEHDLYNLCCPFGVVHKLFLAHEKTETGIERKFGIVKFVQRKDSEEAVRWLDGHAYGKLNLQVVRGTPADLIFAATS